MRKVLGFPTGSTALLAILLLVLGLVAGRAATPAHAVTGTTVTVDGGSPGRTFDGVGAMSAGGGNSRLLLDYPEPQRSEILDYLFRPGYGAALQILKVEIGGDTNSTDGSESSIEHTRGAVDCDNGYEWWLMTQAKERNPGIRLYGLAWGAPGWIGNGRFWSPDMVNYLVSWLGCARQHGLDIDYLGGWNERGYDAGWYQSLHSALADHGFGGVKVVGADSDWSIAGAMRGDSALNSAVDIVGAHYPCGYMSAMTSCSTTADALASGKQLWASENGSKDAETGAAPIARAVNRGYLDAKLTAYINWPLVAALYQNLDFNTMGLVTADQPWSGAYTVGRSAWATAQTTQFTAPGWQYLDASSGYLGGNRANGSYVSYAAPDRSAWSTVLETTTATTAQSVDFAVRGGLPSGTLHVWSTDLSATAPRMEPVADLTPGQYRLSLQPGRVYTVTTTTGQGAGTVSGPQRSRLTLPYTDSLGDYPNEQEARYFSSMNGAFEAAPCGGGRTGACLRQTVPVQPIRWTDESATQPYTLMGDLGWSDYTVSANTLLEQSGAVEILGRVGTQAHNNGGLNAYHLRLSDSGQWSLLASDTRWKFRTLASGYVPAPGTGTWHNLALSFEGTAITAAVDGRELVTVTDDSYGAGQIGLGTAGYYPAQYADLSITPGRPAALDGTYQLVNTGSGQSLDAFAGGTADGTPVIQWPDDGGANQRWQLSSTGDGYYTVTGVGSGKALAAPNGNSWPGLQLALATPGGGAGQQWLVAPAGSGRYTLESRATGDLVDVFEASTTKGTKVVQWPANGGANQRWRLVKVG